MKRRIEPCLSAINLHSDGSSAACGKSASLVERRVNGSNTVSAESAVWGDMQPDTCRFTEQLIFRDS
jgi:hypothetical protein